MSSGFAARLQDIEIGIAVPDLAMRPKKNDDETVQRVKVDILKGGALADPDSATVYFRLVDGAGTALSTILYSDGGVTELAASAHASFPSGSGWRQQTVKISTGQYQAWIEFAVTDEEGLHTVEVGALFSGQAVVASKAFNATLSPVAGRVAGPYPLSGAHTTSYIVAPPLDTAAAHYDGMMAVITDVSAGVACARFITGHDYINAAIEFGDVLPFTPVDGDLVEVYAIPPEVGWNTYDILTGLLETFHESATGVPTATTIPVAGLPSSTDDDYTGRYVQLLDNDFPGSVRFCTRVMRYDGATKTLTVAPQPPFTPAVDDEMVILSDSAINGRYYMKGRLVESTADLSADPTENEPVSVTVVDETSYKVLYKKIFTVPAQLLVEAGDSYRRGGAVLSLKYSEDITTGTGNGDVKWMVGGTGIAVGATVLTGLTDIVTAINVTDGEGKKTQTRSGQVKAAAFPTSGYWALYLVGKVSAAGNTMTCTVYDTSTYEIQTG